MKMISLDVILSVAWADSCFAWMGGSICRRGILKGLLRSNVLKDAPSDKAGVVQLVSSEL